MKRSRKWEYVKQEAIRLAGLGLSDQTIGRRLELDRATVFRWRKAGKLRVEVESVRDPGEVETGSEPDAPVEALAHQTPEQWAAAVRGAYDLDVTDDQLVTLAESALLLARDPAVADPKLRLTAMGRYQALVKQLALVARAAVKAEVPTRKTFAVQRRPASDPRGLLEAVK
jgi:hypothetical protein